MKRAMSSRTARSPSGESKRPPAMGTADAKGSSVKPSQGSPPDPNRSSTTLVKQRVSPGMVGRARWRVRSELVLDELLTARVLRPCAGGRRGGKPTRRRGGLMVSKTGMISLVKAFRWRDVDAGLRENRHLLEFRDE